MKMTGNNNAGGKSKAALRIAGQGTRRFFGDVLHVAGQELRLIFSDGGVLLIFLVAGLLYPLLYNVIYLHGNLNDTPLAVVDEADGAFSRRYVREVDATRECAVACTCTDMEAARRLLQQRKVNGILYFPPDCEERLARGETAAVTVLCDMSSFLYYKNALIAVNQVMLAEMRQIQGDRFRAAGLTEQEVRQLTKFIPYGENHPYNRAFSYNYFLVSVILLLIIQQTMFYGMSLLSGTRRERNGSASRPSGPVLGRSASGPVRDCSVSGQSGPLRNGGTGCLIFGRGAAYWLLYMGIALYVMTIVPAIFGLPQCGNFRDVLVLALIFVTDCVFFSMTWSMCITRRESVFLLFLFLSPVCLFLTGTSWPETAFPAFWKAFSCLFPTTFGCKAYLNISTAGGSLAASAGLIRAMAVQTVLYALLSYIALSLESRSRRFP